MKIKKNNPVEYFFYNLTETRLNYEYFYEYLTIHLITDNAEEEEVL